MNPPVVKSVNISPKRIKQCLKELASTEYADFASYVEALMRSSENWASLVVTAKGKIRELSAEIKELKNGS